MTNNQKQTIPSGGRGRRGRKKGFSLHPQDRGYLATAARLINTRKAANPGEAFRRIVDGDDTAIRRLQRRWKQEGEALLRLDQVASRERCELEYRSLRDTAPDLWGRVAQFAASPAGKCYLRTHSDIHGDPAHPMALGLANLLNIIEAHERGEIPVQGTDVSKLALQTASPNEGNYSVNTQRRFDRAVEVWVDGGVPVNAETLRELARRLNALADNLAAAADEEGES